MLRTLLASALAFFLAFFISRLPTLSLEAFSSNNSQNQLTTLWLQVLRQLHLVAKDGLTIELDYGYFRGKEEDGVQMWLGIPYAQDPYVSFSRISLQYLTDSRIQHRAPSLRCPSPFPTRCRLRERNIQRNSVLTGMPFSAPHYEPRP